MGPGRNQQQFEMTTACRGHHPAAERAGVYDEQRQVGALQGMS